MTEAVERIRKEVGRNAIPEAFNLLEHELRKANREAQLQELISLRADYAGINRKQIIGIVTPADETRRREIIYQILVLAGELLHTDSPVTGQPTPSPVATPEEQLSPDNLPEEVRIVIIAANPTDTFPLRLNDELDAIIQAVQISDQQCKLRFAEPHTRLSAQLVDLIEALIRIRPHIIHFAGHGAEDGNLKLQAIDGRSLDLNPDQLMQLLKLVHDRSPVTAVVFNLCYSYTLLEQAAPLFDYVIGWKGELPDKKGKIFAESFYRPLAVKACESGGLDFKLAFGVGKVALDVMMKGSEGEVSLGGRKVE